MRLYLPVLPLPPTPKVRILTEDNTHLRGISELAIIVGMSDLPAMRTHPICNLGPAMLTRWILTNTSRTLEAPAICPILFEADHALGHCSLVLQNDFLLAERLGDEGRLHGEEPQVNERMEEDEFTTTVRLELDQSCVQRKLTYATTAVTPTMVMVFYDGSTIVYLPHPWAWAML